MSQPGPQSTHLSSTQHAQPALQQAPSSQTGNQSDAQTPVIQSLEERADEARRIRRLNLMMNMVMQVIQQDRNLPVEQASSMVADARGAALAMFPDKALAFDLIYWPRLQRLMRERYRMQ